MTANREAREPGLEVPLSGDSMAVLYAKRLRDGRIALGTRSRGADGEWTPGELHLLDRSAYLSLAGWLAPTIEDAWLDTVREHQEDQLRTAFDLYGEGPAAVEQLARDTIAEISPALLVRALALLINSVGPDARERLVGRLNRTPNTAEEDDLRRRLADEREAFAYSVAAAALFDALERGIAAETDSLPEP